MLFFEMKVLNDPFITWETRIQQIIILREEFCKSFYNATKFCFQIATHVTQIHAKMETVLLPMTLLNVFVKKDIKGNTADVSKID